jgi:hypothetical protein
MAKKHWIEDASQCLEECLVPVPHEVNELDWKVRLSENEERLIEHFILLTGEDFPPDAPAP